MSIARCRVLLFVLAALPAAGCQSMVDQVARECGRYNTISSACQRRAMPISDARRWQESWAKCMRANYSPITLAPPSGCV